MWKGSLLGCWLAGAARWKAGVTKADGLVAFVVRSRRASDVIAIADIRTIEVQAGWLWSKVQIQTRTKLVTLPGAFKLRAGVLVRSLETLVLSDLDQQLGKLRPLVRNSSEKVDAFLAQDRYLRHSDIVAFRGAMRHASELAEMVFDVLDHPYASRLPQSEAFSEQAKRIAGALRPGSGTITRHNEDFIQRELRAHSAFFDLVEKSKLTEEQRRAAVVFEDHNLLVAAAGSGKSSTLIGKAAYAIRRGLFQPSEIVALAFNRRAAAELNERVRTRLSATLDGRRLRANTFHALGALIVRSVAKQTGTRLRVVKEESEKPRLEQVLAKLCKDETFLADWVLFVSLCREPLPAEDAFQSLEDYDSYIEWKRKARKNGEAADFQSLAGKTVRSAEELAIANWLYLKGVVFEYEKRFEPFPPDWDKYEPDFYFPEIDVWYEHFALNAHGEAPYFFKPGYPAQAVKKRQWLDQHVPGRWFETRSHQYREESLFDELERTLTGHGQPFRPRPAHEVLARVRSLRQTDVLDTILKIFHLVKGNGYDCEEVDRRATMLGDRYRAQAFIRVFWPLYDGYNAQLKEEQAIDFDDMIVQAAEHLERGEYASPYRLVMVDEFQDMSPGRARFVKALLDQNEGAVLFGVGDDWQAIYGFAGADLRLFMQFDRVFGVTAENRLSKTFRCPQGISNVAASFIQKNKDGQKPKSVESELDKRVDAVVDLHDVKKDENVFPAVEEYLSKLAAELMSESDGPPTDGKTSVFLLSRYTIEKTAGVSASWLRRLQSKYADLMTVDFLTIHKSKGLEADYVIVLGLNGGKSKAFPSPTKNDPLVDMVLSAHDTFPFAEERRLFYVALTRAKKKCIVFFRQRGVSPFVLELMSPEYSVERPPESPDTVTHLNYG